jgi:hypothetical protein
MSLRIGCSFTKKGVEADFWTHEVRDASTDDYQLSRFNHDPYRSQSDSAGPAPRHLYFDEDADLMSLCANMQAFLREQKVDALIVDSALDLRTSAP